MDTITCKNCGHLITDDDYNANTLMAVCPRCYAVYFSRDKYTISKPLPTVGRKPKADDRAGFEDDDFDLSISHQVQDEAAFSLACNSCGQTIPDEYINQAQQVAVCPNCDAVFSTAEAEIAPRQSATVIEKQKIRTAPRRFRTEHTADGFQIVYHWLSAKAHFLALFTVLWNGFMFFFWSNVVSQGGEDLLCLMPHTLAGIGIAYATLTYYFNSTQITINPREIIVKNGPLPTVGNKVIDLRGVEQFYVKQQVTRSSKGNTTVTYEVHIVTKGKHDRPLVAGLEQSREAFYIEQQIEHYLGIEDEHVSGQYGGR